MPQFPHHVWTMGSADEGAPATPAGGAAFFTRRRRWMMALLLLVVFG